MNSSPKMDVCYAISLSLTLQCNHLALLCMMMMMAVTTMCRRKKNCNVFVSNRKPSPIKSHAISMKFARVREREKTYAIKNWQQPKKKDIKLKVVKASLKIFNLFPISFLSFSWVFSRILTTKQSAIDSHFKCVWWSCFSYTQLPPSSPLKTSSVVIFFCSSKGREYERVKKERRKTNKIIYCLSICVIFFDYNSHISIIFFHHPILSSYAFSLFYRIFFIEMNLSM